jgi:hypothetical protein
MGWLRDEVWLDTDLLWFREQGSPIAALAAAGTLGPALFSPAANGLEASRRRRLAAQAARRRRFATRTVPAAALVLGSATMLPAYASRLAGGQAGPLQADPPSLTFRLDRLFEVPESVFRRPASREAAAKATPSTDFAPVEWRRAMSVGLWFSGRLVDGTQLPIEGPDWVTWNPNTDSVPNLPSRLYGNERTIRAIISVLAAYHAAHPHAPRVVVGDISRRDGGQMDEHVSHQNGLDVDVYYPRLDQRLSAPVTTGQVDRVLAQDLLDRFIAAGARMVFVGYSTGLRGPGGVVVPYPNHANHMHVRFPAPPA